MRTGVTVKVTSDLELDCEYSYSSYDGTVEMVKAFAHDSEIDIWDALDPKLQERILDKCYEDLETDDREPEDFDEDR
jgi:hypothetical protein